MKRFLSVIITLASVLSALAQDTFWLGADISGTTSLEAFGGQLYNAKGEPRENTILMKEFGLNAVRYRVWVDPKDGFCNKEDVLKMALRAKQQGMAIMIDFHYSDWWADPGKQNIPKAWLQLDYQHMCKALANHTRETLQLLKQNEIDVKWVQVGNETTNGFLWPMGQASENMEQYAGLTQAGYDAVKAVYPDAKCIVHLDGGCDPKRYAFIFEGLKKYGTKWDMIGLSIYPYWDIEAKLTATEDETLEKAIANINQLWDTYHTPLMIVETGYNADQPKAGYHFMRRLIAAARYQTGGHCKGIFYWAPEAEGHYKLGAFRNHRPTVIMNAFNPGKPNAPKRQKYEFARNLPTYADSLIAHLDYPLAWGNSPIKKFDKWKKAARDKVFDCMLTPPPAPISGYDVQVIAEEQRDGYKARKVEIRLSQYYTVPAYVLIPDGHGPFPAINLLHDHGAHLYIGKEKMIRPLACEEPEVITDAMEWLQGYEGQFFGDYLAKNGFVVFSADAPMWGERGQKEGARRARYDMIAGNMMMYGIDLSAWMTYDDIAGTEYLAQMPEVDAKRIGCTGWSMGAYRAWMLSALSDRIKAGAAICWMVTTDEQLSLKYDRTENGGFANCLPGLRRWLDYPHIASIACPKAMLFINGSQDKLFPEAGVRKAFNTMLQVWNDQGASDKLETELWDMPHSCPRKAQARVLDFFKKRLNP